MGNRTLIVGISLLLIGCLPANGMASRTVLAPSAVAVIRAPDASEARILIRFEVPSLERGHEIQFAELKFFLPSVSSAEEYDLYAVGRSWSLGSVGWDQPWTAPGGDVRGDRISSWVTDERTGNLVKFPVTEVVRAFASEAADNHGFIVVAADKNEKMPVGTVKAATLTVFTGPGLKRAAE